MMPGTRVHLPPHQWLAPLLTVLTLFALPACAIHLPDAESVPAPSQWTYENQQAWEQCKDKSLRQSPIDIVTKNVVFLPSLKLDFIDYDQDVAFEYKNTHHSVSMVPSQCQRIPSLRLEGLASSQTYELKEIHFHWGNGTNKGSEHEINDQKAAAEMHMVHYRTGLTASDIGTVENSVVVIGVLIESDNIKHNKLESLVKKCDQVNGTDANYVDDERENLINMLPDSRESFFTYNGSLTTPPCHEIVTWIVMSEPVYIDEQNLLELSYLETINPSNKMRHKISANNRDIQPLLNRPVYSSFDIRKSISTQTLRQRIQIEMEAPRNKTMMARLRGAFNKTWRRIRKIRLTSAHKKPAADSP